MGLRKGTRLCENSEARPYVGVEREQLHSILELDDQFFDFSHRLERLRTPLTDSYNHFRRIPRDGSVVTGPAVLLGAALYQRGPIGKVTLSKGNND